MPNNGVLDLQAFRLNRTDLYELVTFSGEAIALGDMSKKLNAFAHIKYFVGSGINQQVNIKTEFSSLRIQKSLIWFMSLWFEMKVANGSCHPLVGRRGFAIETGKTASYANCPKTLRLPPIGCTQC